MVSKALAKAHRVSRNGPAETRPQVRVAGAEGRTRTADTYIFSVVLYRLSYLGTHRILAPPLGRGQAVAASPARRYTGADVDDPARIAHRGWSCRVGRRSEQQRETRDERR